MTRVWDSFDRQAALFGAHHPVSRELGSIPNSTLKDILYVRIYFGAASFRRPCCCALLGMTTEDLLNYY